MKPIKSTNLIAANYNADTKQCDVQFKNGTYRYEGLSADKWAEFESTFQSDDSSGKFFFKHIKPLTFSKIEAKKEE